MSNYFGESASKAAAIIDALTKDVETSSFCKLVRTSEPFDVLAIEFDYMDVADDDTPMANEWHDLTRGEDVCGELYIHQDGPDGVWIMGGWYKVGDLEKSVRELVFPTLTRALCTMCDAAPVNVLAWACITYAIRGL